MKILEYSIKDNDPIFEGFILGTKTDKDVLARACGIFANNCTMTSVNVKLEDDQLIYMFKVDYSTQGEQKLNDISAELKQFAQDKCLDISDVESAYSNAKKCKLSTLNEINIIADLFEDYGAEIFDSSCWLEGRIYLTKINKISGEEDIVIDGDFESDVGLDGVFESISEIHNKYNQDFIIETVEYLLSV